MQSLDIRSRRDSEKADFVAQPVGCHIPASGNSATLAEAGDGRRRFGGACCTGECHQIGWRCGGRALAVAEASPLGRSDKG